MDKTSLPRLHLPLRRQSVPAALPPVCRLLVLGFAGGTVTSLLSLAEAFSSDIDVWGVEYPGHGMQWQRPLHRELGPMMDDLCNAIDALDDTPLVLLGYSMGAQLSHRLALCRPQRIHGLVLLSAPSPHYLDVPDEALQANDESLTAYMRKLGGIPSSVIEHEGLMSLFRPVIRADLSLCRELATSAIQTIKTRVSCPVLALQGNHDPVLKGSSMHQWLGLTSGSPGKNGFRCYDGGHFFHVGRESVLATDVEKWIRHHVLPHYESALYHPPLTTGNICIMTDYEKIRSAFCEGLHQVKRISIDPGDLDATQYLGGDLGIDSIEMLEIWFHAERMLGIRLPDSAKRDVYTIEQVLTVLQAHTDDATQKANHV